MSLSSRAFWRPGGWENLCRLMCHCVRHIGLDNKHGRSVEAIHSFLSRWKACTELCAWGVDGPPGATGVLLGGVPPVKGVWGAAPGSPPQAPIFWGFFD